MQSSIPTCTSCGRFSRGHTGKLGTDCTREPLPQPLRDAVKDSAKKGVHFDTDVLEAGEGRVHPSIAAVTVTTAAAVTTSATAGTSTGLITPSGSSTAADQAAILAAFMKQVTDMIDARLPATPAPAPAAVPASSAPPATTASSAPQVSAPSIAQTVVTQSLPHIVPHVGAMPVAGISGATGGADAAAHAAWIRQLATSTDITPAPPAFIPAPAQGIAQAAPVAALVAAPAHVPRLSRKMEERAQNGEFIDFSEVLQQDLVGKHQPINSDVQATLDSNGHLSFYQKNKTKQVDCLLTWLKAWGLYEATIMRFNPHRYNELAYYRYHISQLDKKYIWPAVMMYDIQFRMKCATYNMPLNTTDVELSCTILDATAVKQVKRCFRCGSPDHQAAECTFPAPASLEKDPRQKKTAAVMAGRGSSTQAAGSSQQGRVRAPLHDGKEICLKFNSGNCTFQQCRRAHVCKDCRGNHPATRCGAAGAVPTTPQ